MKKIFRIGLIAFLLAALLIPVLPAKSVQADSSTFYSSTNDAIIWNGTGGSYSAVHDAAVGQVESSVLIAGQQWDGASQWYIRRLIFYFDTSSLPDDADIASATLYLRGTASTGTTVAFNVVIVNGSVVAEPAGTADYGDLLSVTTSGGSFAVNSDASNWVSNDYNEIQLNATGRGWINLTGTTKLAIRTSRDIASTPVGGAWGENIGVEPAEYAGTDRDPKLVIIYDIENPTTGSASSITATTATLEGTSQEASGPWDVRFNYGLTTGYGSFTSYEDNVANNYAFAHNISSLSPGTVYHFRAQSKDTAEATYEGDDADFLTLPEVPTDFNATKGDTQVVLTWTKGTGADKTMVRYQEGSYPNSITDGTQIYFDTGVTTTKTGLVNGTTYFFSAWSEITDTPGQQYSATYATDSSTPGVPSGPPTTGTASVITATTATLEGTAQDADGPWDVRFNYGLTTGYGTDTTYENNVANSYAFSHAIGSLDPGTIYHFRAQSKDVDEATYEGSDATFLTLPQVPTEFSVQRGDTQVTVTWTTGDGADRTMVRMKETSPPDAIDDGTQIYFGTGTSVVKGGLSNGLTYYFSAWSEVTDGEQKYSSAYVTGYATPGTSGLDPPDTLAIESVEVYTAYKADGLADQLYVISYKIIYDAGNPSEDVTDYFNIDIMDGSVLKARTKVPFWGYRPTSIYLSPTSALTWEGDYTIKLTGTEGMWSTPPSTTYSLSSFNWKGADLTGLDEWVIILANSIEDAESLYTWVEFSPGGGQYLSDYGGRIFRNVISGLAVRRPNLFKTSVSAIEITTTGIEDLPRTYEESLTDNFGTEVMLRFGNFGAHLGLSDVETASAFWLAIMVLVIGGMTVATGSGIIATIIALPVLFGGAYLGVVPLAFVAVLGTLAGIYLLMTLWLART